MRFCSATEVAVLAAHRCFMWLGIPKAVASRCGLGFLMTLCAESSLQVCPLKRMNFPNKALKIVLFIHHSVHLTKSRCLRWSLPCKLALKTEHWVYWRANSRTSDVSQEGSADCTDVDERPLQHANAREMFREADVALLHDGSQCVYSRFLDRYNDVKRVGEHTVPPGRIRLRQAGTEFIEFGRRNTKEHLWPLL